MNDLDLLTNTLSTLNVYYSVRDYNGKIQVTLEDERDSEERSGKPKDQSFVSYTGYGGFAWIFSFDLNGKILQVGGYE